MKAILVASPDRNAGEVIRQCFEPEMSLSLAQNRVACLDLAKTNHFDLLFVDIALLAEGGDSPPEDYKSALAFFKQNFPHSEMVILAPEPRTREAVRAVRSGAADYLTYPFDPSEVRLIGHQIYETQRVRSELHYLRDRFWDKSSQEAIKTKSPLMRRVFDRVLSAAATRTTVLLTGETGVGKGVIAKLIHQNSPRRDRQFISVHCGAIPDTLIESELFGHEKGAFTGAERRRMGKFEIAHGGTIFLDEIATTTPATQVRLLQVLQDRTFQRVGGEKTIEADVRIIAATNTDLKAKVEEGGFRRDLYYRLEVFPIHVPSLRERTEDAPLLIETFLTRLNRLYGKEITEVEAEVLEGLRKYSWPGNIRELENLIERAYILETSNRLTPAGFPNELFDSRPAAARPGPEVSLSLAEARNQAVEECERQYLRELLAKHKGNIRQAAEASGVGARQLRNLLHKYDLRKENYK